MLNPWDVPGQAMVKSGKQRICETDPDHVLPTRQTLINVQVTASNPKCANEPETPWKISMRCNSLLGGSGSP